MQAVAELGRFETEREWLRNNQACRASAMLRYRAKYYGTPRKHLPASAEKSPPTAELKVVMSHVEGPRQENGTPLQSQRRPSMDEIVAEREEKKAHRIVHTHTQDEITRLWYRERKELVEAQQRDMTRKLTGRGKLERQLQRAEATAGQKSGVKKLATREQVVKNARAKMDALHLEIDALLESQNRKLARMDSRFERCIEERQIHEADMFRRASATNNSQTKEKSDITYPGAVTQSPQWVSGSEDASIVVDTHSPSAYISPPPSAGRRLGGVLVQSGTAHLRPNSGAVPETSMHTISYSPSVNEPPSEADQLIVSESQPAVDAVVIGDATTSIPLQPELQPEPNFEDDHTSSSEFNGSTVVHSYVPLPEAVLPRRPMFHRKKPPPPIYRLASTPSSQAQAHSHAAVGAAKAPLTPYSRKRHSDEQSAAESVNVGSFAGMFATPSLLSVGSINSATTSLSRNLMAQSASPEQANQSSTPRLPHFVEGHGIEKVGDVGSHTTSLIGYCPLLLPHICSRESMTSLLPPDEERETDAVMRGIENLMDDPSDSLIDEELSFVSQQDESRDGTVEHFVSGGGNTETPAEIITAAGVSDDLVSHSKYGAEDSLSLHAPIVPVSPVDLLESTRAAESVKLLKECAPLIAHNEVMRVRFRHKLAMRKVWKWKPNSTARPSTTMNLGKLDEEEKRYALKPRPPYLPRSAIAVAQGREARRLLRLQKKKEAEKKEAEALRVSPVCTSEDDAESDSVASVDVDGWGSQWGANGVLTGTAMGGALAVRAVFHRAESAEPSPARQEEASS